MEEVALYVIHGVLHLTGHDDRSKKKNAVMRRKENEIFREVKKNI
jgi:rRNA maturation RNase YbeY